MALSSSKPALNVTSVASVAGDLEQGAKAPTWLQMAKFGHLFQSSIAWQCGNSGRPWECFPGPKERLDKSAIYCMFSTD
jgi:hypothetical protein